MNDPILYTIKKIETNEGYEVLQEDVIKCANCYKPLVEVVKVKEDPARTNVIVAKCPFCGDSSFRYKITGRLYIGNVEGTVIDDCPVDKVGDTFYSTIKVSKDVKIRK